MAVGTPFTFIASEADVAGLVADLAGKATVVDLSAHIDDNAAHGATSTNTPGAIMARDGDGKAHASAFDGGTFNGGDVISSGSVRADGGFSFGATAGFTGTGAYTTFTIQGGIITAAS